MVKKNTGEVKEKKPQPKGPDFAVKATKWKVDAQGFGVVIYGDDSVYTESVGENLNIHFKSTKEEVFEKLIELSKRFVKYSPSEVIIGHEHGDKNGKCHYQCAVYYPGRVNRIVEPGFFEINGEKHLYMFQAMVRKEALFNYCRKGGDYYEKNDLESYKNAWEMIAKKKNLNDGDVIDILQTADPMKLLMWGDKILSNYKKYCRENELPEFEWKFPEHLLRTVNGEFDTIELAEQWNEIGLVYEWFTRNCLEVRERYKGLILYGGRALGKTCFAKSLVPHEDYYIYCRGSIDGREFRKPKAKLIILDDIEFKVEQIEMWKALLSGESVTLNTKWEMYNFPGGMPCLVMTNSLDMLKYFMVTAKDLFATQMYAVELKHYIGPKGTKKRDLFEVKHALSDETMRKLKLK